MLNELFALSNAMDGAGIERYDWHREYKPLPSGPCIRIWISDHGSIDGMERLDPELTSLLRKYGNNQRTFPACNIGPLYRIVDDEQTKALKQIEKDVSTFDFETIKAWCTKDNDNWHKSLKTIDRNLNEIACELSKITIEQTSSKQNIVTELSSAVNKLDGGLRNSLEKYVFDKLGRSEDIESLLKVLFFTGNPKKDPMDDINKGISVIFDLSDWSEFDYPVAHEETTHWINDILLRHDQQNVSGGIDGVDAFGLPYTYISEPMPEVNVQGNIVRLRSMFRDQHCQQRYGTYDSESYPISKTNRAGVKRSLEWIADREKEGITWAKADDKEVVFVYPSKLQADLKFASFFGESSGKGKGAEKRFEEIARDFTKTLRGLPVEETPDNIRIFSIRKMDKARTKVTLTRNLTPERLVQSAEIWQEGCNNLPEMRAIRCIVPFPLQVAKIVNNVWKQNGELANGSKDAVKRMQYYQGMELLIDPPLEDEIKNYLNILLSNSTGLIASFGNQDHDPLIAKKPISKKEEKTLANGKEELSRLLPLFSLLIYKGGHRKEDYMEKTGYQIGQLLKVSDELHALYCNVVREGAVPPQLAGNSVFLAASETPVRALAQLGARMNPYISWAKQYRSKNVISSEGNGVNKGKESWRAAWYFSLYESICNALCAELTESTRFNEFDKAQMFIGYLAAFPKKERHEKDDMIGTNKFGEVEGG